MNGQLPPADPSWYSLPPDYRGVGRVKRLRVTLELLPAFFLLDPKQRFRSSGFPEDGKIIDARCFTQPDCQFIEFLVASDTFLSVCAASWDDIPFFEVHYTYLGDSAVKEAIALSLLRKTLGSVSWDGCKAGGPFHRPGSFDMDVEAAARDMKAAGIEWEVKT